MQSLLSVVLVTSILFTISHAGIDSWIRPDAWFRAEEQSPIDVNAGDTVVAGIDPKVSAALVFYNKMVRNVFDPNKMQFDVESNLYTREIKLTVTKDQMEFLRETNDVYKMDEIVSEALVSAKSCENSFVNCQSDWFQSFFSATLSSPERRFVSVTAIVIAILWYIIKRCHYGWAGTTALVLVLIFIFGYLHTYYECNRDLETDELIKLLEPGNPCEQHMREKENHWFWNVFKKSAKQDCIEHIRSQQKWKLPFCRPEKVLLVYINEITFHQMEQFLLRTGNAFNKSFGNIGIVHTALGGLFLIFLMNVTLKSVFKYGLGAMTHPSHSPASNAQNSSNVQNVQPMICSCNHDAISVHALEKVTDIYMKLTNSTPRIGNSNPSGVEMIASSSDEINKDLVSLKKENDAKQENVVECEEITLESDQNSNVVDVNEEKIK